MISGSKDFSLMYVLRVLVCASVYLYLCAYVVCICIYVRMCVYLYLCACMYLYLCAYVVLWSFPLTLILMANKTVA